MCSVLNILLSLGSSSKGHLGFGCLGTAQKPWPDALLCFSPPPRAQLLCKEWLMPHSISLMWLCILYTAMEIYIWVWTGTTCTEEMRRTAKARGTLGLATSHQLLACGSEVILPAGHHSPVQESTFNLNQLLQSVHHLLQHLLLSKISQRHQEEHEMWTPSCALQHNLYLAPFLWISSYPSSPSLLQANHYVKGCLKTSADGFSIAQSTSKTFNFHRPCDTGSIASSAFHIQGKRGREHWHTQGKAAKLNETMGKTKQNPHSIL